ncbi:peptidoglycan-binding protein [Aquabacterium fontiphilum]|jgi:hypothetical protein|uniref:CsgG/HfaB family protein n=1 Tax=Aquabacterium fontiphilum TaxID=450365 RepID=UPI001378311B|nr:CsgG/HfaB family protein [Aquabacterium fontiphilum]NBD19681.1 peptidoglycan-binding protein [Aquabacterium fontiphilum]
MLSPSVLRAPARSLPLSISALIGAALLSGCVATAPKLGDNKGTVSGAAGGETAENRNSQLESCPEALGTLAIEEDTGAEWYRSLQEHRLGSTVPVLRLMIQQSNCFVIVDRGRAMNNMMRERELARGDETRAGSNFQKGQMVAADYTMSPAIQFSGKTGGGRAGLGGFGGGVLGFVAGNLGKNEASTTLLLVDNRSGVQISAAEGTASNFDFGLFGAAFGGGVGGGAGGYAKTPEGKVITAAFADSFNQMVKALRNYKAQQVRGGLGTGGRLGVQGGDTAASRELDAKPAAGATKPATTKSTARK